MKPTTTTINDLNRNEMYRYKERRRFSNYKEKAHYYFDKLWRDVKVMSRDDAYKWLADKLNIGNAHISVLNDRQCEEVIYYSQQLLNDCRRFDLDMGIKPLTPFYVL